MSSALQDKVKSALHEAKGKLKAGRAERKLGEIKTVLGR